MNVEKRMTRREILALLAALTGGAVTGATAQDAAKINPRGYRVAFENDKLRVLEYVSKPGLGVCGQGKHSHPQHLTIVLSNGKAKARGADGKVHVHEAKAGDMFWAPAETHEVENVSGRDMRCFMVEYKDRDWKPSTG
jgi:beta-alanine degradation protein BauB